MGNPDPEDISLKAELVKLRDDVQGKIRRRRTKGTRWKAANYLVGGLSAILGVTAGAGVFADLAEQSAGWKFVVGALALASGLLGALVGFYNFGQRSVRVMHEEGVWREIKGDMDVALDSWEEADAAGCRRVYQQLNNRHAAQIKDDAAARKPK